MASEKVLTISVVNRSGGAVYWTGMSLSSGFLSSTNPGNVIPNSKSSLVLMPFADPAGPVGAFSFSLSGSSGQRLAVNFEWEDTSKPGATVTASGVVGFLITIGNNQLTDPNQPSCEITIEQELNSV